MNPPQQAAGAAAAADDRLAEVIDLRPGADGTDQIAAAPVIDLRPEGGPVIDVTEPAPTTTDPNGGHGADGPTAVDPVTGLDQAAVAAEARRQEISDRLAEIFEVEEDPDEFFRREAIGAEISGRRTLLRAAFTAAVGGAIIGLVSLAFGPRFFVSDVRVVGMFVGLAIIALSIVAPIDPGSRKASTGALIIVCAVIGFPVAAGGYFIGSVTAIIGGALLVAYEPPVGDVAVVVRRASRLRRLTALFVDFVIAFVLQRILYTLLPTFFMTTLNVVVAWLFCWTVVALVPSIWSRRTPGRILMVLRPVDIASGAYPPLGSSVIRELLRGLVSIGTFFVVAHVALRSEFNRVAVVVALVALVGIGYAVERYRVLDRVTGTASVYDAIEPLEQPQPDDTDAVDGDAPTSTADLTPT